MVFKVKLHWNISISIVERCCAQTGKMQKSVQKSFISLRVASSLNYSSHFRNVCLITMFPTGLLIVMTD